MLKKKDVWVIAAILAAAMILLGLSQYMPKTQLETKTAQTTMAPDAVTYTATPEPEEARTQETLEATAAADEPSSPPADATQKPKADTAAGEGSSFGPMPPKAAEKIGGHVVITVAGRQYGDPIPMDRDKIITVRQADGKENRVHITPSSVYMEHSSCDNQDCVGQGEITLENYQTRILSTWVICLPNNVTIEMIPAD